VAEVTHVIHGGGRGSGLMILKPRVKGARGSEDHLCKRNCPMTVPISGYLAASGGGSHLSIGGETATEKEASVDFFLLIGGREREVVVLVPHVGDGQPTACQSGGNAA
jgi:hypothetical protein